MPVPFLTAFELGHLSDFFPLSQADTGKDFTQHRPPVQREALAAALRASLPPLARVLSRGVGERWQVDAHSP